MDVTPLIKQGAQIIQSYAGGRFRVSGEIYTTPVIVTPDSTRPWDIEDSGGGVKGLRAEDFMTLHEGADAVDVILCGTGEKMEFPDIATRKVLKERSLVVEFMDTGAACRTYNVLMAEGRRVAAVLLPF